MVFSDVADREVAKDSAVCFRFFGSVPEDGGIGVTKPDAFAGIVPLTLAFKHGDE